MLCKIGIAVLKWAVNVEDHSVFGENLAIPVKGQHAAAGGDDGWTKYAYPQHLVSIVKWKSRRSESSFPMVVFPLLVKPHKIIGQFLAISNPFYNKSISLQQIS